jgi:FtsZ-binding cell division protein ZapB
VDNYEQLKADNKRLKKQNEWLQQDNSDLNKEIEAAYERIHQLTIKIEEMF